MLEEQRNRDLPPMAAVSTPEEYDALADRAASRLMRFLEEEEIVTVEDYFEPSLREHLGELVREERREKRSGTFRARERRSPRR